VSWIQISSSTTSLDVNTPTPIPMLVMPTRCTSVPCAPLRMVMARVIASVPGGLMVTCSGQTPQSSTAVTEMSTTSAYVPAATATIPPNAAFAIPSPIVVHGADSLPSLVPMNDASTNCVVASTGMPSYFAGPHGATGRQVVSPGTAI